MSFRDVFSTGQAAKICRVSQQTIIRCFESGQLKGYRVPGSTFRRIPWTDLYRFMTDCKLDTAPLEMNVLLHSESTAAFDELRTEFVARLNGKPGQVVQVSSMIALGEKAAQLPPCIIVLDCRTHPVSDGCFRALRALKAERETMNLPLVIVALAPLSGSASERIRTFVDLLLPDSSAAETMVARSMELFG